MKVLLAVLVAIIGVHSQDVENGKRCINDLKLQSHKIEHHNETGLQLFESMKFSKSGKVTGWTFIADRTDIPVFIGVYNRFEHWIDQVGVSMIQPKIVGWNTVELQPKDQFFVGAGDFIGIHYLRDQVFFGHDGFHPEFKDYGVLPYRAGAEGEVRVMEGFSQDDWNDHGTFALDTSDAVESKGQIAVQAKLCPFIRTTPEPPVPVTRVPPKKESKCVFPFKYRFNTYNTCINDGDYWWCSTDSSYDGNYKVCDSKDPIPDNMPCHFPFEYDGHKYEQCAVSRGKHWCAVQPKYDGTNWRYCDKRTDRLPQKQSCALPFTYDGKTYKKCSKIGTDKPWCALTREYERGNWRYCEDAIDIEAHPNELVADHRAASDYCWLHDEVLATEAEIRAAWDMGKEQCECGWTDGGKAFKYPQAGGKCESDPGVQECKTDQGIPLCVKPSNLPK